VQDLYNWHFSTLPLLDPDPPGFSCPPNICGLAGTGSSLAGARLVGVARPRRLIKMSDMDEDVYDEEEDYDLVS
jgi:hypothetical protein